MKTINDRFRQIYKDSGLSQEAFAKEIKRGRGEIANIIYDKTEPKDNIIDVVCACFGINKEWLLTGEGEMKKQLTEDDELTSLFSKLMREDDSENLARAKRAFIAEMLKLDPAAWEKILEIAKILSEKEQQETE